MNFFYTVFLLTFLFAGPASYGSSIGISNKKETSPKIFLRKDYINLLADYDKKLKAAEEAQNTLLIAELYNKKGKVHLKLQNYYSAIIAFQRCLKLRDEHNAPKLNSYAYGRLGDIYLKLGYYKSALTYYQKALFFGKKSKSNPLIAANSADIGKAYILLDSLQPALTHYKKAYQLYQNTNMPKTISAVLNRKAVVYDKLEMPDSAIHYLHLAMEIQKENNDLKGLLRTYLNLGKQNLSVKNYDLAIDDFQEAIVLSNIFEDMPSKGKALKFLAKTYKEAGKESLSYGYYQRYVAFEDSLSAYKKENFEHIKAAVNKEKLSVELKRLKRRHELLSRQTKVQLLGLDSNRIMIILLTAFVILFILLLVLYYERYKERKNRNAALEEAVRKRTAELNNTYQRLSFHVTNTFLGVVETDHTTSITKWSLQAEKIFGWKAAEVLGKKIDQLQLIHEDDLKKFNFLIRNLGNITNTRRFFRTRNYNKQGEILYIEWNVSAMFDSGGNLQSILCMANNATERERAFAGLETANKELDNFIYKTSHDVKGPIARIQGIINLGLMETKDQTSQNYFTLLNQVSSEFDIVLSRLFRIHNLYYHKLEVVALDLRKEIMYLLKNLQRKNSLYDLEYRLDIPRNLKWNTDKLLLYMIIQNIYENALDYRSNGLTYLVFSAEVINDHKLILKVKDNGIGIPEQVGDRVFDMFFQSTRDSVTSGLGLYMVKKSVEKLGGTIELMQNDIEDTVFEIILPGSCYC